MWWKVFISKWLCSTNFQFLAPLVITWSLISSVPNGIMLWIAALWIEASKLLKRWFPECTWENWQDKSLLICVGKVNAIYFNLTTISTELGFLGNFVLLLLKTCSLYHEKLFIRVVNDISSQVFNNFFSASDIMEPVHCWYIEPRNKEKSLN